MREICLDTETTGLKPQEGHRVIEIGAVELVNHVPTGERFHVYINPERDVPEGAVKVHGLTAEFLADKPKFAEVAQDFLDFIGDAPLVIHNAEFDRGFLNWELGMLNLPQIPPEQCIDTLLMARRKWPAGPNSLDALCRRFGIDNSHRTLHGALLDAEILAEVYLELIGGRQIGLSLSAAPGAETPSPAAAPRADVSAAPRRRRPAPLPPRLTEADIAVHRAFVETLGDDPLWKKYDF